MTHANSMNGYGLLFVPLSWAIGRWVKPHKTLWALGPFRFVVHTSLGKWRETP